MSKTYSLEEVKLNNGQNGAPVWIIVEKSIYDVTIFLNEHPGGKELIEECCGKDGTKSFNQAGHSGYAVTMLQKYKIGTLATNVECNKEEYVKRRRRFFFCM